MPYGPTVPLKECCMTLCGCVDISICTFLFRLSQTPCFKLWLQSMLKTSAVNPTKVYETCWAVLINFTTPVRFCYLFHGYLMKCIMLCHILVSLESYTFKITISYTFVFSTVIKPLLAELSILTLTYST